MTVVPTTKRRRKATTAAAASASSSPAAEAKVPAVPRTRPAAVAAAAEEFLEELLDSLTFTKEDQTLWTELIQGNTTNLWQITTQQTSTSTVTPTIQEDGTTESFAAEEDESLKPTISNRSTNASHRPVAARVALATRVLHRLLQQKYNNNNKTDDQPPSSNKIVTRGYNNNNDTEESFSSAIVVLMEDNDTTNTSTPKPKPTTIHPDNNKGSMGYLYRLAWVLAQAVTTLASTTTTTTTTQTYKRQNK